VEVLFYSLVAVRSLGIHNCDLSVEAFYAGRTSEIARESSGSAESGGKIVPLMGKVKNGRRDNNVDLGTSNLQECLVFSVTMTTGSK
jgi:hypothetical protein